ncbi:MAG: nucleoside hydrolase [Actinomycetota bacterium]|nr:nucleoside hydrolase [Actinomycetota bacterium]
MPAEQIILDCDPGHDDAIALLLALASPEVELVGVTTVSGNQTLDKTTANALRVLEFAERSDIPVAAGADRPLVREQYAAAHVHGESGLDGPDLPPAQGAPLGQHAVDFLAEQIRARDGELTLVPIGPLTNIALLLALHPDARPERIVLMGGAIGEGNITPAAEFNIWADPEAARRVFESGLDVTMIGLDVTHQAVITPEHAERLRAAGRVGEMVAELVEFYGKFHGRSYPELGGSPMHDPVALAHVTRAGLVQVGEFAVAVDCSWGLGRGRTNVDRRGRSGLPPNAKVGVAIDGEAFAEHLLARIASL